jgi:hypothetical protein
VRAWITTPANVSRLAIAVGGIVVVVAGIIILMKPAVDWTAKTVSEVKPV